MYGSPSWGLGETLSYRDRVIANRYPIVYDLLVIITLDDLVDIRIRHKNKKIVLTSGTYDLFHIGHLNYLKAIKSYGDIVAVMLSGDARISARKGSERPIFPENERAQILDALKIVDYVFIDPSKQKPDSVDPVHTDIISKLQPDLYVTDGDDIRFSKILDKSKLVILPRTEGGKHGSTTAIIKHITGRS